MATAIHGGSNDFLERLAGIVGPEDLFTDVQDRQFYGADVFRPGETPVAVVRPASVEALQAVVRLCAQTRTPLTVRGGGASYTDGYIHRRPGGITIDTGRLTRIAVDEVDLTVTVEAGVTWAMLRDHLAAHGLRTRFFGPFSGLVATVGGSMSQHSLSHGPGVSAESALGFDIVTGTGDMLSTGTGGGTLGNHFFRFFGPDLAGLFTGDCGALGVKARIVLPLIRRHEAFDAASFSFPNFAAMHAAMRAIAVEQLDDENFGLDATLQQGQIGRQDGVGAKVEIARSVMKAAGSFTGGVKTLARMATAGDAALRAADYVVHYLADGVDQAAATARIETIRRIGASFGTTIANSVPTVVRAMPFAPLTNVLGPRGERWVPMHGLFAHSQVLPFHEALSAYWDRQRADMQRLGVYAGGMFMAVGSTAFLYEPAFYWPDARDVYHQRMVPADHLAGLPTYEANPEARSLIDTLRGDIRSLMQAHGAAHLQIGKVYPYLEHRNPAGVALLRAIKTALDPHDILNPGALGLGGDKA